MPDRSNNQRYPRKGHRDRTGWFETIVSGATLLVTIVAAIGAVFAARYTYGQWQTALDTEHRQLRAYAYIIFDHPAFPPGKRVDLGAKVRILGQTPAYDVAVEVRSGPSGISDFINRADEEINGNQDAQCNKRTAVGPSPEDYFSFPYFSRVLTEQESYDINGTSNAFFAHGKITYRDIFQCWHWVNYCYQFAGHGSEPIECQGTLHPNEVDDDGYCHAKPPQCTPTVPQPL